MNLFKQVQAVSRGRYATHLFTNCIHREEEMVCAQKEWGMMELLFLLSLLAVRHMLREHIRTISKNADNEHSLEELSTLHPYFIAIFAVIYFYMLFEKMCSLYHRAFLSVKHRFLLALHPSEGKLSSCLRRFPPSLSFPHSSQIMLHCIFPLPYVFRQNNFKIYNIQYPSLSIYHP
jgi:hypothetical protein